MAFTYFFRDMQTLEAIQEHALPHLRTRRYINIWDAGCAMGPEPYSLAIILRESMGHMYFRNIRIRGTDIDSSNLFEKIIKEGVYPKEQIDRIDKDILERYFIADEKRENFQLIEEIRNAVTFKKHNLLSNEPIGQDFGLVVCKNVLLHFTEEQRIMVYQMFYNSLIDGGFLVTEQTQKLPNEVAHLFEQVVSNTQLFRKK